MRTRKELFQTAQKRAIALMCITSMLLLNTGAMIVQAGPLDNIGGWISERANDASDIAGEAGKAIGEKASSAGEAIGNGISTAGGFIGENASSAADWVANSDAGQFVGKYTGIAGEWIGKNAAAAGKMVGENAAIAKVWIGENAKIAGSWIGENASAASDWLGVNASNACNWIVENGTIVGAWIGETASGARVWIGENASAAGTMIGETASGAGIWVNEKVTDINSWIKENALFSEDGIAILGDNLKSLGIEKKEELEELAIGIQNYVENIDPSVYTTKEYYIQSGEKFLLGEYSAANMTGLAVGLNVVASIVNLDMAMDLRDLAYDIQYIGDGSVGFVELGIDAASCLPVIGVVKNVKYLDDVADVVKAVDGITDVADSVKDASKVADVIDDVKDASKVADVIDDVKDASKVADIVDDAKDVSKAAEIVDDVKDASTAAEVADDVKDASKVTDTVDDVVDAGKAISKTPLNELPEGVQETFKKYNDYDWDGKKALKEMNPGTDAGRVFRNDEGILPETDVWGKELSYTEFDAYPFGDDPNTSGRGLCRFVRDNLGNTYFTDDHYETFTLIESITE